MQHVNVSGATPSDVAGQPAYTVSVSPKHDGGLLGSVALAWDAVRGVPLRFAVYAQGNPDPVIELTADNISYGAVPASDFAITPPTGAKVVTIGSSHDATALRSRQDAPAPSRDQRPGRGQEQAELLAGRSRQPRRPAAAHGQPAQLRRQPGCAGHLWPGPRRHRGHRARPPERSSSSAGSGSQDSGQGPSTLSLPTVSINGATGHELDTALGTLVTFTRGGVDYTVVGLGALGGGRRSRARAVSTGPGAAVPGHAGTRRRSRSEAWSSATGS